MLNIPLTLISYKCIYRKQLLTQNMSVRSPSRLPKANVTCYINTTMTNPIQPCLHTSLHSKDQYKRVNATKCVKHACLWIMFASPGNNIPPSGYFSKTDRTAFQFLSPHFSPSLILFPRSDSSSVSKLGC